MSTPSRSSTSPGTLRVLAASVFAGGARLVTGAVPRWAAEPPAEHAQTIFFANHTSHFDFVVLWSSLPAAVRAQTRPVAAADYWASGLKHALACNLFRAVLVERHAAPAPADGQPAPPRIDTLKPMCDALAEGDSLILFPEGTRGDGETVAPFKSGIFRLLQQFPQVEARPVYLENLSRVLPKGEVLPVPLICKLTFGEPLQCGAGETKEAFLARAHDALCALREPA